MTWFSDYIGRCRQLAGDKDAREHSYRTATENMLNAAKEEFRIPVDIVQEPGLFEERITPDFRVSAMGGGVVGYVECKKPGTDLDSVLKSEQMKKYRALSDNFVLTDYWRWWLLRKGEAVEKIELSSKTNAQRRKEFLRLLDVFLGAEAERIGDSKRLAESLAVRGVLLRDSLTKKIGEAGKLRGLFDAFRKQIYRDMTETEFADAFAQTTAYSLLMAKLRAADGEKLDLFSVEKHIPQTFALIRELSGFLRELNNAEYGELLWLVEDILAVVNNIDAAAVIDTMPDTQTAGAEEGGDPFLYFYENFLAAYDAELKMKRGVFYTPLPVVRFIVRAADDILKNHFGMDGGLAAKEVTALDFAAGTGTFLLEMMRLAMNGKDKSERNLLAKERLLKNFHGFEFLITPYTLAHLKLSQFLAAMGCELDGAKNEKQLKIFLTDTLEKAFDYPELSNFLPALSEETRLAGEAKKTPILLIVGNPPYSANSQTASKEVGKRQHKKIKDREVKDIRDTWIGGLLKTYYRVDGEKLNEANPKLLQDDYVKFIRFAQWKMENVEHGVVAIITNHGFLDNVTFRGMRQSLLNTFDQLYFLDLHGNVNKRETAPDGGKDENVFDIMQGVCISLLVKKPRMKKTVRHADFYGPREKKYAECEERSIASVKWRKIKPASPDYFFIPRDEKTAKIYEKFYSVKNIFVAWNTGVKTHRDHFAFAFGKDGIIRRMEDMADKQLSDDDFRERYSIRDTRDWSLAAARKLVQQKKTAPLADNIRKCSYRPFDERWCFYGKEAMELPKEIMRHMTVGDNLGLVSVRQVAELDFNHAFITDKIIECRLTLSNKGGAYLFPLYRYEQMNGHMEKTENFRPEFRRWIDKRYGKKHPAEKILSCIYAVLHSPDYRRRYREFLRLDFPRIPFPKENAEFLRLAKIGKELIDAHLLGGKKLKLSVKLHGDDLTVEKVRHSGDRLFINNTAYFAPIPAEVFNFPIGGYLPLDKYLKSRKGRTLTLDDADTVKKAAAAIAFTLQKMGEI